MSIVSSYFPGRIRLRAAILKDAAIVEALLKALEGNSAIKSTQWNPKTGSLLVEYDSNVIKPEKLAFLIPEVKHLQRKVLFYSEKNRAELLAELPIFKEKIEKALAN